MPQSLLTSPLAPDRDPLGRALRDYHGGRTDAEIHVTCNRADDDVLPVAHLFRTFRQMPRLEQTALRTCRGRVLDVGAGAGAHTLWLQQHHHVVTALDHSAAAVAVMRARGVQDARAEPLADFQGDPYDTVLLMMNGAGLAGTLDALPAFLTRLRGWLRPGGQVLLDSSDLWFLYEEEDGSYRIDLNDHYHGEMVYRMHYDGVSSDPFPWLFVGFDLLHDAAQMAGLQAVCLVEGPHHDYLARLTRA